MRGNITTSLAKVFFSTKQTITHVIASMHYIIKDQKLYKKALGHMDGFSIFTDSILLGLLRRTKLPDVDFIFDMGDWPTTRQGSDPIPVFGWAGSDHRKGKKSQ